MALTLEEKKAVVAEVAEVAGRAHSAVAVEYRGLTVDQMTGLRAKARGENVYLRVVKNSLARRAVEGTDFECMGDNLTGPLMLAFSEEDPGAAARVLRSFAKENDKLVLRRGFKIEPDEPILIVEDVVMRGGRAQEAIDIVREHGGTVAGLAVLVDRSQGNASFDCPFVSLLEMGFPTFDPDNLPEHLKSIPAIKPGS